MNRFLVIGVVAALLLVSAVGGFRAAQSPSAPTMQAADETLELRLQELGLTEDQIQDTIVAGVEAFIEQQQQAQRDAQRQQQEAAASRLRPASTEDDFIRGAENAEFTMIEYSDFECPFCKRFHDTGVSFTRNNEEVNWVHRHFPLPNHNPQALQAAVGAECVGHDQGSEAYWSYNDRYYETTRSGGRGMPDQSVIELMMASGMAEADAEACLNDIEMQARVEAMQEEGQQSGVTGTPGIFIRHNPTGQVTRIPGAVPLPDLQNRFEQFQQEVAG